jgi:hypothetical protein
LPMFDSCIHQNDGKYSSKAKQLSLAHLQHKQTGVLYQPRGNTALMTTTEGDTWIRTSSIAAIA